jgi:hypothetical protein
LECSEHTGFRCPAGKEISIVFKEFLPILPDLRSGGFSPTPYFSSRIRGTRKNRPSVLQAFCKASARESETVG